MRGHIRPMVAAALALAAIAAAPAEGQLFAECTVNGGGRLTTTSGDMATFGGSASTQRGGTEVYIDHGPATPLQFRSLVITAVICNPDARRAEIIGTGEADGEIVQFRIAIFDSRPQSTVPDFYRITLSNTYDSGEQPVQGGITMHVGDILVGP